jgi:hypothetical protein
MNKLRRGELYICDTEEKLGCIYVAKCISTSKSYVGQAKLVKYKENGDLKYPYRYGVRGRWNDHVSSAKMSDRNYPIFNAIRQFGKDAFELSILDIVLLEELDIKETEWIIRLDTIIPNGYNVQATSPNIHTLGRIQVLRDKYGDSYNQVNQEVVDDIKRVLQLSLIDKFQEKIKTLETHGAITKIRIAQARNTSAKRMDGHNVPYICITVYVYTTDMTYAKEAIKFRFGGVTVSLKEAYDEAIQFTNKLPQTENTKLIDQIHFERS